MDELAGRTAVITGGASGIGLALAKRFAAAGMNVAIGDIEEPALDAAMAELSELGTGMLGRRTDVTSLDSVVELHEAVTERYGDTNVLCLNAGVAGGTGDLAELTIADWRWTIDVNLYGIIHGLCAFLPGMRRHDDGHVVITASIAGLTSYAGMAPYNLSKHGAVSIAESLHADLAVAGCDLGVSCLCPGLVMTNIFTSDRNRPETLRNPLVPEPPSADDHARIEALIELVTTRARPAEEVADLVHDAVLAQQFWVYTDEVFTSAVEARLDAIRDRIGPPGAAGLLDAYE